MKDVEVWLIYWMSWWVRGTWRLILRPAATVEHFGVFFSAGEKFLESENLWGVAWFVFSTEERGAAGQRQSQRVKLPVEEELGTFGLSWAQRCGSSERRVCVGASGRGSGSLTVASRHLTAPSSLPAEPVRRRRAGCGNGLWHKDTQAQSFLFFVPNAAVFNILKTLQQGRNLYCTLHI